MIPTRYDFVVIGAGPAGQKAAIQAAKSGCRVLMIDRGGAVGGECVQRGTIPSKTLRETAASFLGMRRRCPGLFSGEMSGEVRVNALMQRLAAVRDAHESFIGNQIDRNGIELWRGRASFAAPDVLEVTSVDGSHRRVTATTFVIATGSRPRTPPNIPVDHEHLLDSDSILSLIYLPKSLVVLGGGVIASEFATIFAALGSEVTMIDKAARPLGFLDPELTDCFVTNLELNGSRFLGGRQIEKVEHDGVTTVTTTLAGGETVRSEKLLCALGRVAQVRGLNVESIGLEMTPHGHIAVDACFRTAQPHIYAAGDVIGPPSLAATSMEQGRRAARHALGLALESGAGPTPAGIYTIPEMATVGLTEAQTIERFGSAWVGRARYDELARGHIVGETSGLLKLVADPEGRVVGAHIIGENATELVHVAQMAIAANFDTEAFVENIFNFPTLAEGYRVAALDIAGQRHAARRAAA